MLRIPYKQLLRRYGVPTLSKFLGKETAEALFADAARWLVFACARALISKERLAQKAFSALVFSIKNQALGKSQGFQVPSKLAGVSNFQDRLIQLRESGETPQLTLSVSKDQSGKKRIVCLHRGKTLGLVQEKHVPWLAPLVKAGAGARVLQVTGDGPDAGRYHGLNVAFTDLADAIRKL